MYRKEDLLSTLNEHADLYERFRLKGAFLLYNDEYYPIKLCFHSLKKDERLADTTFDYGDLLLLDVELPNNKIVEIINNLGNAYKLEISSYRIHIPHGYFRSLDEDSSKIAPLYGGHVHLSDYERTLLTVTRSFPNSLFRQWPTETYIYKFSPESNINNLYSFKSDKPLPIIKELPVLPDYYTALKWWFGEEMLSLPGWSIFFFLPVYKARIKAVEFAKNEFIIKIEEGLLKKHVLQGKYFISYDDSSVEYGDMDFTRRNKIAVKERVHRFYIVLFTQDNINDPIDYRNYDFRYWSEKDMDIVYENSNIEYWLAEGETDEVEFKVKLDGNKPKEFIESVCSFLNTKGGHILLGVDDNANVRGLDDEEIAKYSTKIPDLIRHWIEPKIQVKLKVLVAKDKRVLVVSVPKGGNPPYYYVEHGVYIRANSTDRIASREELLRLTSKEHGPWGSLG